MRIQPSLFDPPEPLTREQLIDRIIEINPSATTTFLSAFEHSSLARYLDHLAAAEAPRGRDARWVRPGDTPAILARTSRF